LTFFAILPHDRQSLESKRPQAEDRAGAEARARMCCAPRSYRANRLRSGLEREAAVEERDDAGLPLLVSPDGQTQSVISGLVAVPVLAVEWEPGAA
jgi:hypothetical protein